MKATLKFFFDIIGNMTFINYILVFLTLAFWPVANVHYASASVRNYSHAAMGTLESGGCCQCNGKFNDTAYMNVACGNPKPFMKIVEALAMARCDIADPCRRLGTDAPPKQEWFDFIVVGAGVAGPIIARRLSDNQWWRVLLIEAGPEEPSLTAIPGLAFNAIDSQLDWHYLTEPTQPHPTACLAKGGVCTWPRGKMISGTAGMNGMMYVRGHPSIYDEWARLGNDGWSYAEIEKYFERAENPVNPEFKQKSTFKHHNTGAPMTIDLFPHKPPFADDILKAATEMGYRTSGLREDAQTGFAIAPMLVHNGLRGTTARYYLRPVAGRSNLYVMTNAQVTKVLTEDWGKRAYGVELVDKEGKTRKFMANKEIILTAGAIGSPQILLQSGIGPKEDLKRLGIPVVKDLPVGKNLQNHVSVGIKMTIKDKYYEVLSVNTLNEYIHNRTGPLSSTGLTQVTAFFESSYATPGVPDLQSFFDGFSSKCARTGLDSECHRDGSIDKCPYLREIVARPTVVIAKSRGYLTLNSTNPLDHPKIYPNYFTDNDDLEILLQGIKKLLALSKTKAMRKWDLKLDTTPHPLCKTFRFGTDTYWKCVIRTETGPENHQSGTCRMGPANDPESVVDPELKVLGVPDLRVADASIFPILTNANPVAPIVMVAEKAADMITTQWKNKPTKDRATDNSEQTIL